MNLLVALLATRAFVIVTPETVDDQARSAQVNDQLRQVLRDHRELTFGVLSLPGYLTGKRAAHIKPRKKAQKMLDEARRAYGELDVEGAISILKEAQLVAQQGLASRKGATTWANIQLELGLRLWEMEDPSGVQMVTQVLALFPKIDLPAGTQLSETMGEQMEQMRQQKGGAETISFTSAEPMIVRVADHQCVTPCTLQGLSKGSIPWRATAPGLMTQGGVGRSGGAVDIPHQLVPKRQQLISKLEPLWSLPQTEADLLLADQRKHFAAPQFLWVRVGAKRLSVLRGQVVPRGALFYRGETAVGESIKDDELLGVVQSTLAADAEVGAPIRSLGLATQLSQWWSKNKPSLPTVSLPKVSRRALAVSGLTVASTAAIAGVVVYLSTRPDEGRGFDPVLGY